MHVIHRRALYAAKYGDSSTAFKTSLPPLGGLPWSSPGLPGGSNQSSSTGSARLSITYLLFLLVNWIMWRQRPCRIHPDWHLCCCWTSHLTLKGRYYEHLPQVEEWELNQLVHEKHWKGACYKGAPGSTSSFGKGSTGGLRWQQLLQALGVQQWRPQAESLPLEELTFWCVDRQ